MQETTQVFNDKRISKKCQGRGAGVDENVCRTMLQEVIKASRQLEEKTKILRRKFCRGLLFYLLKRIIELRS